MSIRRVASPGRKDPGVMDALALLPTVVGNELVLATVRDTHRAWAGRTHRILRRLTRDRSRPVEAIHDGIAASVYTSIGLGLGVVGMAARTAGAVGVGPRLEDSVRGRFVRASVNGLIGDRFEREGSPLAIDLGIRRDGADIPPQREALVDAFPGASPRVAVFIHGLSEDERFWDLGRGTVGTTYPDAVQRLGWTPVMLRVNTGRAIRENGLELAALLRALVEEWPHEVERIALVGHSMGGLVARAACAVRSDDNRPWTSLVSDVVTLGSPHFGAPIAVGLGHGSALLAALPETSAFGKVLDHRSVGIEDLVDGLGDDVPPLPGVNYRLVAATLTESATHPVGRFVGDLLVRVPSAHGKARCHPGLFPDAEVLHVPRTDHFGLLNHPEVHRRLEGWLA